jgi:hypothetical protein
MNAMVGDGPNLLVASNADTEVFQSTVLGATTNFASVPLPSAGDLTFNNKTLYESATDAADNSALVNVNSGTVIGEFTAGAALFNDVFGLATDAAGTTYAVAGTEIYTVNLSNAVLTPVLNYGGQFLGAANGTAFIQENVPPGTVPEPSTWAMMLLGFAGLAFAGMRRARCTVVT